MKLVLLSLALTFSLPSLSNEELAESVFFQYCMNLGQDVSPGFQSCVNSNFQRFSLAYPDAPMLGSCFNFGDTVSSAFTSCVNRNFFSIVGYFNQGFVRSCFNFDRDRLSPSYVSCVNGNFSEVERLTR